MCNFSRMAVLARPKVWKQTRPAGETRRTSDLTPEEQANVRRALVFLRTRLGGWTRLAAAMRTNETTTRQAGTRGRSVSAGLAIRAARVAGVPVDELLAGRWPKEGTCPHCGRD